MSDLISRQKLIESLQERYKLYDWNDGGAEKAECGAIIREIFDFPSAEPEIIRCKDCIWHLKDDSCARLYRITDDYFYCWHGRRAE